MPAGNSGAPRRDGALRLLLALTLLCGTAAQAIDDPNAPDRTAAFKARAQVHEQRLGNTSGGVDSIEAGQAYAEFLDQELNRTYRLLLRKLEGPERQALATSQRQWLKFRDAELEFASLHWVRARSGSSFSLSRALHRTALIRSRVLALLATLQEYPDPPAVR